MRGPACALLINGKVVVTANGPLDAEYALFDVGDIELRSSEPGRVREVGYETTAELARARLATQGVTSALARECALAMHPVLSEAYARGPAVRHVARYLGPVEVFKSDGYDAGERRYAGVFLELATLVDDAGTEGLGTALQCLYLAALLDEVGDNAPIVLSTDVWTRSRRAGERTHRRPSLGALKEVSSALSDLSARNPAPTLESVLPRSEVIAFLQARAESAADEDARALFVSLERAVSIRERPERGPLSDPELWFIEARIDAGDLEGLVASIDRLELERGKTPGTTYLRARLALALKLEPAKLIAERVSALALSMSSFFELELLAAEAWLEAGDLRRAHPYARDLVDAVGIDEGLLLRARRLMTLTAAGHSERARKQTISDSRPPGPLPPSQAPPVSAPDREGRLSFTPQPELGFRRPKTNPGLGIPSIPPSIKPPSLTPPSQPRPISEFPDISAIPGPPLPPVPPPPRTGSLHPVPRSSPPVDPGPASRPVASFTLDLPGPEDARRSSRPPKKRTSPPPRRLSGAVIESLPPRSNQDPRAEANEESPFTKITQRDPAAPASARPGPPPTPPPLRSLKPSPASSRPARPRPANSSGARPAVDPEGQAALPRRSDDQGASLPPYRRETPAPLLPRAPLFPRHATPSDELVEHLSLPGGLVAEGRSAHDLPGSVLEARIHFTSLARELGLDYRLKRGIELKADLSGIEQMQSVLFETFADHVIRPDDVVELRRHGALLSEILARRLDAEWIDISPAELGYWAMIVPPDTRVWPFGRVARLVTMAHKERDLVSYFLELSARSRRG